MLSTLEGERHVRRSLLREVIDVAAEEPGLERARSAADALLKAMQDGIEDKEFDRRVQLIAESL